MAGKPSTFHEFGILPDDLQPPAGPVRAALSPGRVIAQYIMTAVLLAAGGGAIWFTQWLLPSPLDWVGCAATALATLALIYLGTHRDYCWIELNGQTLRAQHLYTGRVVERSVRDIAHLLSIVISGAHLETAIVNAMLGRVKGMDIRFRDGKTPLKIMRTDPKMTNAEELLQAVVYRMTEVGEIEPEVVDFEGKPLVRSIHWFSEPPPRPYNNVATVMLVVFLIAAACVGLLIGGIGMQEQDLFDASRLPPHELTVAELIQNGPGENRHITLTGFEPGGMYYEMRKNSQVWSQVWIALFPIGQETEEIKVVLSSKHVSGEGALQQLLQANRVTGICSKTLRTSWGTELGPNLVKHSEGKPLTAAWNVEELREPPTAAAIKGYYLGAYISYALTLVLSLIAVGKTLLGK